MQTWDAPPTAPAGTLTGEPLANDGAGHNDGHASHPRHRGYVRLAIHARGGPAAVAGEYVKTQALRGELPPSTPVQVAVNDLQDIVEVDEGYGNLSDAVIDPTRAPAARLPQARERSLVAEAPGASSASSAAKTWAFVHANRSRGTSLKSLS